MKELAFASIPTIREYLDNKKISYQELLDFYAQRFAQYDGQIGSALEIFDTPSILKNFSATQGSLLGVPGLIKNNISQQGRITACASRILSNFHATYDATVCERLKNAGALLMGRANMDEFAMGSSTESSAFKKCRNPWDLERVPGGSSGGSAAAVAAGLVPWALGTDTGGSVRQPSAYCGVVGLKPTYGLVSRYGIAAYASSLDQVGVITRSVYDNALVFSTIAGVDAHDSSTLHVGPQDYTQGLDGKLPQGLRVGVVKEAFEAEGMDPEVIAAMHDALKTFEKLGAQIMPISLPTLEYSAAAYFVLSRAEAASNLARYTGVQAGVRDKSAKTLHEMYLSSRHDGFGQEVRKRIMVGNYVLSAGHAGKFYENAKVVQRLIRREFKTAFENVDVILMPTQPEPAFKLGAYDQDKLKVDLQDYFTCPVNLAGIPGISVPCGYSKNNLPIGVQILGPHLAESLLYKVAYAYEQQMPWYIKHPQQYL